LARHADAPPLAAPSVKQHLSAIKMMFDYLVTGQIVRSNPAASVRGPKHIVHRGKTPVLAGPEAKELLVSIPDNKISGLRDRALIATMVYSFARVSAVVGMNVEDFHTDGGGRTMWLRLHEKGSKFHEVPVHHLAIKYLDAYLEAAGIRDQKKTPLFRAFDKKGKLTEKRLDRRDVWAMIKRRAKKTGLSPGRKKGDSQQIWVD
jgi:site-specific recombinase XerC